MKVLHVIKLMFSDVDSIIYLVPKFMFQSLLGDILCVNLVSVLLIILPNSISITQPNIKFLFLYLRNKRIEVKPHPHCWDAKDRAG